MNPNWDGKGSSRASFIFDSKHSVNSGSTVIRNTYYHWCRIFRRSLCFLAWKIFYLIPGSLCFGFEHMVTRLCWLLTVSCNGNLACYVLLQSYFLYFWLWAWCIQSYQAMEALFFFPHKCLKTHQSAVFIIHFSLLCCHHWTSLFQSLWEKMTRNIAFYFLVPSLD